MDNPEKLTRQGTQDEEKQNNNTMCVGQYYPQTNTNNVIKRRALLQTIGGKEKQSFVFMRNRNCDCDCLMLIV
jgi:hypothetical protein